MLFSPHHIDHSAVSHTAWANQSTIIF